MTIKAKVKELLRVRETLKDLGNTALKLKSQRDTLQVGIISDLKKQGYKSVKTDQATISRQVSRTLTIIDEPALIKDLQSRKLTDYIKEQVDRSLWRSFQTQAVKQGMKLKGTEIRETEYISVRKAKEVAGK